MFPIDSKKQSSFYWIKHCSTTHKLLVSTCKKHALSHSIDYMEDFLITETPTKQHTARLEVLRERCGTNHSSATIVLWGNVAEDQSARLPRNPRDLRCLYHLTLGSSGIWMDRLRQTKKRFRVLIFPFRVCLCHILPDPKLQFTRGRHKVLTYRCSSWEATRGIPW